MAAAHRTAGPDQRGLNDVKSLGSATSTVRTTDQTQAATWWHCRRFGLAHGNPAFTAGPGWTPLAVTPPFPGPHLLDGGDHGGAARLLQPR